MLQKLEQTMGLDQETKDSTDRILAAGALAEAGLELLISSRCVEPYGYMGNRLRLRPCALSELKQFELVWFRQVNQKDFHLAYVSVVSPSASWLCLANTNPEHFITLWRADIAEIFQAVSRSVTPE